MKQTPSTERWRHPPYDTDDRPEREDPVLYRVLDLLPEGLTISLGISLFAWGVFSFVVVYRLWMGDPHA